VYTESEKQIKLSIRPDGTSLRILLVQEVMGFKSRADQYSPCCQRLSTTSTWWWGLSQSRRVGHHSLVTPEMY